MSKRDRHVFKSKLGEFTAVANASKIAAIVDERDKAVADRYSMNRFMCILGYGPDFAGHPVWGKGRGFKLSFVDDVVDAPCSTEMYYPIERIHEALAGAENPWGEYEAKSFFQTTFAFEALSGGLFTTLPVDWTAEQLEEAKATERDIIGEEKAAIAETLTEMDKVEIRAAFQGINYAFRLVGEMEGEYEDKIRGGICGFDEGNKMYADWTRKLGLHKDLLPEKMYKLLLLPDERPWLVFSFGRAAFLDLYNRNYTKTTKLMDMLFTGPVCLFDDHDKKLATKLEDKTVPILDRVKLVKGMAKKYEQEQAAARKLPRVKDAPRAGPNLYEQQRAKRRKLLERGQEAIAQEGKGA